MRTWAFVSMSCSLALSLFATHHASLVHTRLFKFATRQLEQLFALFRRTALEGAVLIRKIEFDASEVI